MGTTKLQFVNLFKPLVVEPIEDNTTNDIESVCKPQSQTNDKPQAESCVSVNQVLEIQDP